MLFVSITAEGDAETVASFAARSFAHRVAAVDHVALKARIT